MRRRTTLSLLIASSLFMAGGQTNPEGTEQGGGAWILYTSGAAGGRPRVS